MTARRHLSTAEVLSLLELGTDGPRARAEGHLFTCAPCRLELEHYRALRSGIPTEGPSEAALLRAFALVRPPAPRRAERVRYAAPRLVYDSRTEIAAVAGLRGPGAGGHLAWSAARADVEVRWGEEGAAGGAMMTGQVLPRGEVAPGQVGDVWLEQSGAPIAWSMLGPSGEFTLPVPRTRKWRILLAWGDLRLRLAP